MNSKKKNVRINIKLTDLDRENYKQYCLQIGTVISKRIRELMNLDMNGKIYSKNE